jgi:hypothetical protein
MPRFPWTFNIFAIFNIFRQPRQIFSSRPFLIVAIQDANELTRALPPR